MKNFKAYRWAAVLLLLSAVLLQTALPVCAKTAKKMANTAAKTAAKTEARASSDPVWDIILFWGQSNIGFYFDFGALINLKTSYYRNGQKVPEDQSKSPLYGDLTMGICYKNEIGSKVTIIGAFGPQFTYFSRENRYYYEYHIKNI